MIFDFMLVFAMFGIFYFFSPSNGIFLERESGILGHEMAKEAERFDITLI